MQLRFDDTLKDRGAYWPYAQDGMYEKTGRYDARPKDKKGDNDAKMCRDYHDVKSCQNKGASDGLD